MITEDYVSFEVAKLLKEKGFDELCNHYYFYKKLKEVNYYEKNSDGKYLEEVEYCTAPTLQMAMKWLRNKGIYIQIRRNINTYLYGAIMLKDGSNIYATIPSELETYEEAVEAALKYTLENLI